MGMQNLVPLGFQALVAGNKSPSSLHDAANFLPLSPTFPRTFERANVMRNKVLTV